MGIFSSTHFDSFETLFMDQIQDLYDAEQRLTKALPLMEQAAQNANLKAAFRSHLQETQGHVRRLEKVFQIMGKSPESKTCQAMKGLVAEGQEAIDATGDPNLKDAALIAAAQRVEHYEMAGYGTARTFAQHMGKQEAVRLLQETLNEEEACDKKLTQIAETNVNRQAVHA
jgi:ferritin-like metal-binding protein YciE